jgi:hypothetical protein
LQSARAKRVGGLPNPGAAQQKDLAYVATYLAYVATYLAYVATYLAYVATYQAYVATWGKARVVRSSERALERASPEA